MSHDPILFVRVLTGVAKSVTYGILAVTFWHFRKRSQFGAVCLALTISFATGTAMTLLRALATFIDMEPYLTWGEILASLLTFVCAYSIIKSTWR